MLSTKTVRAVFYLCALCFIFSGYGCKKNESPLPNLIKGKEEQPKEPGQPEKPVKAILIPTILSTKNLRIEFKYEGETNQLIEIIQSDGSSIKFFYRPNRSPISYEHYKGNKLQQEVNYMVDKEGKIYKILLFDSKSASAGYYTITYDQEDRITQLKKYAANNLIIEEENMSYDLNGNLLSQAKITKNSTSTISTSYDTRSGIYQHIPYIQLLLLTQEHSKAIYSKNNPLISSYLPSSISACNYTYEYNTNDYPSNIQMSQGSNMETMKLTYKTFKPT